jgi:hypothetical protein
VANVRTDGRRNTAYPPGCGTVGNTFPTVAPSSAAALVGREGWNATERALFECMTTRCEFTEIASALRCPSTTQISFLPHRLGQLPPSAHRCTAVRGKERAKVGETVYAETDHRGACHSGPAGRFRLRETAAPACPGGGAGAANAVRLRPSFRRTSQCWLGSGVRDGHFCRLAELGRPNSTRKHRSHLGRP